MADAAKAGNQLGDDELLLDEDELLELARRRVPGVGADVGDDDDDGEA